MPTAIKQQFAIPSLEEMLQHGVHFGHQTSRRHPKMQPYIFTNRQRVSVIDLERTQDKLREAMEFAHQITVNGGVILFVGSKKQARDIVRDAAIRCGAPYIVGRWIGGIFTNFENVGKLIEKMKKLEDDEQSGEWNKYKKSEQMAFKKEQLKLNEFVGGIRAMTKLPKAIFVVDIKKEKTAIAEATKKNIPIIAMTDTNVNPDKVQYPIPANDDAINSINLITKCIADAILAGRSAAVQKESAVEPKKPAAKQTARVSNE